MERPLESGDPHRATGLLRAWGAGDAAALEQLIPLVHDELRRLARRFMAGERAGHTLQPTALVNEAYLRLVDLRQMQWPRGRRVQETRRRRTPGLLRRGAVRVTRTGR